MRDTRIVDKLNKALSISSRDLIHYILQISYPRHTEEAADLDEVLEEILAAEDRMTETIATMIDELGGVADPETYPLDHGHYNFLDLDYLLPRLTEELRESARRFEEITESLREAPLAYARLKEMGRRKHRHVERLESFASDLETVNAEQAEETA